MILRVGPQPVSALESAAGFHSVTLPVAKDMLDRKPEHLVIVFPPAAYDHRAWRLAVVQDLAREAAPIRVNAVAGDDDGAIAEAVKFLEDSPGFTGQLLSVDGKSGEID